MAAAERISGYLWRLTWKGALGDVGGRVGSSGLRESVLLAVLRDVGGGCGLRYLLVECGGFAGGKEIWDIVKICGKRRDTVRREVLCLFLLCHE